MISKMAFGVRRVREFLSYHGCVLTVRGYDYKTNSASVPELNGIRIKRKTVCKIKSIDDLNGFVALSGFGTVAEWWVQIRRFCKGKMWLYRVQIDDTWLSRQEQDNEKIEQQRMFTEMNIEEQTEHPMDIRGIDIDPALVDLQPHKDAVRSARIQREAEATKRRHERMRMRYEEHGEITKMVSGA